MKAHTHHNFALKLIYPKAATSLPTCLIFTQLTYLPVTINTTGHEVSYANDTVILCAKNDRSYTSIIL